MDVMTDLQIEFGNLLQLKQSQPKVGEVVLEKLDEAVPYPYPLQEQPPQDPVSPLPTKLYKSPRNPLIRSPLSSLEKAIANVSVKPKNIKTPVRKSKGKDWKKILETNGIISKKSFKKSKASPPCTFKTRSSIKLQKIDTDDDSDKISKSDSADSSQINTSLSSSDDDSSSKNSSTEQEYVKEPPPLSEFELMMKGVEELAVLDSARPVSPNFVENFQSKEVVRKQRVTITDPEAEESLESTSSSHSSSSCSDISSGLDVIVEDWNGDELSGLYLDDLMVDPTLPNPFLLNPHV